MTTLSVTNRTGQTFRMNGAFPVPVGSSASPAVSGDQPYPDITAILPGAQCTWAAPDVSGVLALLAPYRLVTDAAADAFNARNPLGPPWSGLTYTVSP